MAGPRRPPTVDEARNSAESQKSLNKTEAAKEVKRLWRDNTTLAGRLKRREDRISHLDKKIARVEKEVRL
jgi:predicted RNase H-like nuclease (RuvC/YqgF family)